MILQDQENCPIEFLAIEMKRHNIMARLGTSSTKIDLRQELLIGTFLRFFFLTKKNTSKTRIQICEQKIPRLFIFFFNLKQISTMNKRGSHRT